VLGLPAEAGDAGEAGEGWGGRHGCRRSRRAPGALPAGRSRDAGAAGEGGPAVRGVGPHAAVVCGDQGSPARHRFGSRQPPAFVV
jgi:hypothetical protein